MLQRSLDHPAPKNLPACCQCFLSTAAAPFCYTLLFVMDVINMESEVSPLAVQSCDHVVKEEENTTVESTDSTYVFEWEMKIEENAVPITFPVIKFEPEEETFGMARVKQESQLEVATEESEILTDSSTFPHVQGASSVSRDLILILIGLDRGHINFFLFRGSINF
ncbi:uncharacterized protein [Periplaneta americana]|uniref:uncharacterized protein isoform X3 n=1 Tax=Periplaneta americana TaxID=6978 RepID=UPI0037E7F021